MAALILLALLLAALALYLFWQSARQRREAGIPAGRVIYSDTRAWGKVEKPFYDSLTGLTGRPDYLIEQNGFWIPVEVKSGYAPSSPHEGHLYQLAAYCLLVERASGKRPPYGILHYRNRTYAIDYTADLEAGLLDLLAEMRQQERRDDIPRSHAEPARCARCGYRSICDQKI
jgi:CRISPR-associated exonuclease Cas4